MKKWAKYSKVQKHYVVFSFFSCVCVCFFFFVVVVVVDAATNMLHIQAVVSISDYCSEATPMF